MPVSLPNVFRLLVLLVMAVHGFHMYCMARTMGESVGFHWGIAMGSGLFALIMMIPLVPAVGLPELPEVFSRNRCQRRWRAGRCPSCGYLLTGIESATCPECAGPLQPPEGYRFTLATIRRFLTIVVLAWLVGSVAGEGWTVHDERSFAQEVRRYGLEQTTHARARRWPSEHRSLLYVPGEGVVASD